MKCPLCGGQIPAKAGFCPLCVHELPSRTPRLWGVVVVFGVTIVVIVLAWAATRAPFIPGPASTPKPMNTPRSTSTSKPTNTPRPTSTSKPTETPRPTSTLKPTDTPRPTPTYARTFGQVTDTQGDQLNVREGAGDKYLVIGLLLEGSVVQVLRRDPSGQWLWVQEAKGVQGWVSARYLRILSSGDPLPVSSDLAPAGPKGPDPRFRADQYDLPAGGCTTLRWEAPQARYVYLDQLQVANSGTQSLCPRSSGEHLLEVVSEEGWLTPWSLTIRVSPTATPAARPTTDPHFRADRATIARGDCTTLRWDVDGIQAVYLDDREQVGHGSTSVCPTQTQTFTLEIVEQDGRWTFYHLVITVSGVTEVPSFAVEHKGCIGGTPPDVGQVKGQIFDRNGNIIVGAVVAVTVDGYSPLGPSRSDAAGWYGWNFTPGQNIRFVSLQVGEQAVRLSPEGFTVKSVAGCYQRVDFRQR